MNLKFSILKLLHASIPLTLLFSPSCFPHERQTSTSTSGSISQDAFKNCDFQFSDTTHLIRAIARNNGLGLRLGYACSFYLTRKGFFTLGNEDATLMITSDYGTLIDQAASQSGFEYKPDRGWKFIGNSFSAGKLLKYQKLSFEKIDNEKDITLVGRQIEHGTDQTGTPMTFEGVHVLRISPTYVISIDMPFDQNTSAITRDEVVKDLLQLVNSVHSIAPTSPATAESH